MNTTKDLVKETIPPQTNTYSNATSLVEYLSRPARKKIVQCLCGVFLEQQTALRNPGARPNSPGRPPRSGVTIVASMVGVSRKAVGRWFNGEMQSSNVNAERLLNIALEFIPKTLSEILIEDLERHRFEVEAYLGAMGVGHNLCIGENLDP